jgi:ATP-dependent exoDNAse (exonuclease V) alpha subunit
LKNLLYISVGAAVVLEQNLCPEFGLANGSVGIVHDIFYENDKPPPENLPKFIWVEFEDYTGRSFFHENNTARAQWVPIHPVQARDYSDTRARTRTMVPLRLAWAMTIWKSQGQTIHGKVVINLGDKEKEHGLSYVAFSRATAISDFGITGGICLDRLTFKNLKVAKIEDTVA